MYTIGQYRLLWVHVEVYMGYASGREFLREISSASAANLESLVKGHVSKSSTIITDSWVSIMA